MAGKYTTILCCLYEKLNAVLYVLRALVSGLTQSTLKFLHFYEYTGMLSKHRSQALWLALMMHLLFHFGEEGSLSDDASDAAMKAAINLRERHANRQQWSQRRGVWKRRYRSVNQMNYLWTLSTSSMQPPTPHFWCLSCESPWSLARDNTVHVIYSKQVYMCSGLGKGVTWERYTFWENWGQSSAYLINWLIIVFMSS